MFTQAGIIRIWPYLLHTVFSLLSNPYFKAFKSLVERSIQDVVNVHAWSSKVRNETISNVRLDVWLLSPEGGAHLAQ